MWRHADFRTVPDIIRHWAQRTPDKVALTEGSLEVTYGALDRSASRIANAIVDAGLPSRSHIGFMGKNSVEFWELWFGATKAGCAIAPLNWRCPAPELVELVDDAEMRLVVVSSEFEATMKEVADQAALELDLVVFDPQPGVSDRLGHWTGAKAETDPMAEVAMGDTALLAYTSGTTGRPKGVQISHEAIDFSMLSDHLEPTISWSADDISLMVMPGFHLAGSWVSLPALYHNATVAIVPAFEPAAALAAISTHRPTKVCLVPAAMQALLDHPDTASTDFSSLRSLLYAGSAIGAETLRRATAAFGCDMMQFYGTTETWIITLLRPAEHDFDNLDKLASCGTPMPLVEIRLVDPDGVDVEGDAVGEILVRTPIMFTGYFNQPEATAAALQDGWYRTGDLARRDSDGFVYIVDRAKDMLVSGGENVYSVEVERALQRHPDVAMVAVIGTPDPKWGEAVTAFVVPVPGRELDADALRAHCRELIAGYKVPKIVHIEESLPVTPSGKVKKPELRARVE